MALATDLAFLVAENKRRPTKLKETDIAKWIEGRRILPTETPFPGPWRNDRTPYLTEIMDTWAEPHVREVAFCAGPQTGKSETMLNCLAWMTDQRTGDDVAQRDVLILFDFLAEREWREPVHQQNTGQRGRAEVRQAGRVRRARSQRPPRRTRPATAGCCCPSSCTTFRWRRRRSKRGRYD